jgi:hypothetical protein
MGSIARVQWRKKAKHLTQAVQGSWRREAEQEREAEKHRQGQPVPAPQGVHPLRRLSFPILIALVFLLEGAWIVFLIYLSVKFIRLYI